MVVTLGSAIELFRADDHQYKGEISVDRVLEYDVWTLNINSSTFSHQDRSIYIGVGDTLLTDLI
jgi:hypothetical protein